MPEVSLNNGFMQRSLDARRGSLSRAKVVPTAAVNPPSRETVGRAVSPQQRQRQLNLAEREATLRSAIARVEADIGNAAASAAAKKASLKSRAAALENELKKAAAQAEADISSWAAAMEAKLSSVTANSRSEPEECLEL